jgi:hypothetical protein
MMGIAVGNLVVASLAAGAGHMHAEMIDVRYPRGQLLLKLCDGAFVRRILPLPASSIAKHHHQAHAPATKKDLGFAS